ncbi:restriction endonuclease subunit S [Brucella anthropi]|uniref:restriction endonuclease subunit S n=1 Tax=Brucella anthropi TaxID=529 RepID=UPI0026717227|nr:restriction endonuclease subunit S [Brucella anthropi]WKT92438.1 restriction endonuclease subunit S [Brucella anthropi]
MSLEPRWTIPRGWDWTPIEAIAEVTGGGTPSANDPSNFADNGGIPWVTPSDLTGYGDTYIARGRRNLSDRGYKNSSAKLLPAGAVLFTSRAPIGYCAIAANPIATNQGFKSLTLFGGISGEFTRHYLKWSKPYLESLASGTTFLELSGSKLQQVPFPLPPLAEQKRIVAKLDALNAKSARTRTELARIETLVSRYKQVVLSKAFSGERTREWPLLPLDLLSEVIFDGPFGSNLKSADYTADGPRVVRLENIGAREFIEEKRTHISEAKFRSLARHALQASDLLFSSFVSEEIRACLFPADTDFQAINKADCFCIRLDAAKINPQFALLQLTSETTYRHFVQQVHGATRPRINLSQLKNYSLLVPTVEEQHEIVRRIESAFDKVDRLAREVKRALELVARLDEAMLAKAFRGELIPQDENDEPAEHLLARIRAEREAAPKIKQRVVKRTSAMLTASDFLNAKLPNWPHDGISFQDLKSEFNGSYDDLKDAVFTLLSDKNALLRQVFDEKRSVMTLKRREQ